MRILELVTMPDGVRVFVSGTVAEQWRDRWDLSMLADFNGYEADGRLVHVSAKHVSRVYVREEPDA